MHLDVTSEENWTQVVNAVMAVHGRLDILFNNAGVSFPMKVEDMTVAIWDRKLAVHAKGAFLRTKAAIPAMRRVCTPIGCLGSAGDIASGVLFLAGCDAADAQVRAIVVVRPEPLYGPVPYLLDGFNDVSI